MALVEQPYIVVTLSYRDNDNNTARSEYYIPSTNILSLAAATAVAVALIAIIQTLTDAVIEAYSIRFEAFETDGAVLDAPETSEVSRKGRFKFRTVARTTGVLEIPSIDNSLVVDGSNTISPLNPAVAAFIALVLDGPPGVNNGLTTGSGVQYNQFISATKGHDRSSEG